MNVAYNEINAKDAARMIGVDYSTVAGWCRKNLINYADVGDGDKKPRYLLLEKEVEHLKSLKQRYGTRKLLLYYHKDWERPVKQEEKVVEPVVTEKEEVTTRKKFDMEEVATTISYIQDIKERLEDLEAEKNQLTAELEQLRKEVMEYL